MGMKVYGDLFIYRKGCYRSLFYCLIVSCFALWAGPELLEGQRFLLLPKAKRQGRLKTLYDPSRFQVVVVPTLDSFLFPFYSITLLFIIKYKQERILVKLLFVYLFLYANV